MIAGTRAEEGAHTITGLLHDWRLCNQRAASQLLELVYGELHKIASREMRRERGEHTLQATALVNEAYVRLCGGSDQPNWNDRAHFFAVAAQQMRRIVVDHARRVQSEKRGGDQVMFELLEGDGGTVGFDERLVAVDQALARLHALDERAARVIGRDPIRLYGPFHGPRVHDLAGLCAAPCG